MQANGQAGSGAGVQTDRQTATQTVRQADRLAGRQAGRLAGRLAGWLAAWLAAWQPGWLARGLAGWQAGRLAGWQHVAVATTTFIFPATCWLASWPAGWLLAAKCCCGNRGVHVSSNLLAGRLAGCRLRNVAVAAAAFTFPAILEFTGDYRQQDLSLGVAQYGWLKCIRISNASGLVMHQD